VLVDRENRVMDQGSVYNPKLKVNTFQIDYQTCRDIVAADEMPDWQACNSIQK